MWKFMNNLQIFTEYHKKLEWTETYAPNAHNPANNQFIISITSEVRQKTLSWRGLCHNVCKSVSPKAVVAVTVAAAAVVVHVVVVAVVVVAVVVVVVVVVVVAADYYYYYYYYYYWGKSSNSGKTFTLQKKNNKLMVGAWRRFARKVY